MKTFQKIVVLLIIFIAFSFIAMTTNVYAAGIGMSINKSSAYIGDSFRVTISGINGKVSIKGSSNISLNKSGTQWVEGSMTITGTAKSEGTGTITVTPIDASTTSADPVEVTSSASRSIKISKKKTETKKPTTTTTTNKTTTTSKTTSTTNKTTETKKEDNFYISKLELNIIKSENEKTAVELSPKFSKDVYEYTCKVASDVNKLEIEKDAGEYTKSVTIKGNEELKEGENIITVELADKDHKAKTYTIKVTKEAASVTTSNEPEASTEDKKEKETAMISMPVWQFVIIQIVIIIVEVFIIYLILKKKLSHNRRNKYGV